MERFEKKIVLITGGSGDIGSATAERIMEEGGTCILSSIDEPGLKAVTEALNAKGLKGSAEYCYCDAMDYAAFEKMVAEIGAKYGRLDVLALCHGIERHHPIDELSIEDWQAVIDVNLTSTFLAIKACVPQMKKQNYGRIAMVSSLGGRRGRPVVGANYAASKAGMVGLTMLLGYELGPWNITVNAVAPGPLNGRMSKSKTPEQVEKLLSDTRIHRLGEMWEIAAAIAYLSSDDAGWITGQVLDINGGIHY